MMPERDLQVTVHSKYYGLVAKVVKCILVCQQNRCQQVKGGDYSPLFSAVRLQLA